ncbi:MAG: toxin-antitoxin system YwqK family antitoxin [Fluviicola sp.]|nr:toxin-antitoxin system YwqK family antitoxin [Fluviicola sp.]
MKLLLIFAALLSFAVSAQSINISNLKGFLYKKSIDEVKAYVEPKGWKFYKKKTEESGLESTTWTYKYTAKTDEAVAWLTITCDGTKPVRTMYEIFDFSLTMPFSTSIYESDFQFEHIEQSETEFTKRYANAELYMWEYQNKDFEKGYQYELIRKFSKADFRNGTTKKYYPNGQLKTQYQMKEGKLDGESRSYHENENIKKIAQWKNDKEEGLAQFFDENGVLSSDETYHDGRLEGPARFYYANGQVRELVNYSFDKENGDAKRYSEDGTLEKEWKYIGGVKFGAMKEYTNGKESFSCFYTNGKLNGYFTETFFTEAGDAYATATGFMKEDYVDGKYVAMYANKRDTMFSKMYKDFKPVGVWRYFDKKGQLEQTVRFNNGHADIKEIFIDTKLSERVKMIKSTVDYWYFSYDIYDGEVQMHVEYRIPTEELEPNMSEFTVFFRETGINDGNTLLEAPFKFGHYRYENENLVFEGDYNGGGFKQGKWSRTYKKAKVIASLSYDDTGVLTEEIFTKSNGKVYSGTLKYTITGETQNSVEIKKGLRNGLTIEKDASGKEILRENYENGIYVD